MNLSDTKTELTLVTTEYNCTMRVYKFYVAIYCTRIYLGEYKNLNTVKFFWKYLLNGDGYYFAWDEIIFSKQAARPFSILTPIMKCSH